MEGISVISQSSSLYPVDVTFHLLNCSHVVLQPNVSVTSHHVPFTRFRPDFLAPFVSLLPPLKPLALSSSVTWVSRVAINSSPPNPPTPTVWILLRHASPLWGAAKLQPSFSTTFAGSFHPMSRKRAWHQRHILSHGFWLKARGLEEAPRTGHHGWGSDLRSKNLI